MTLTLKEAVALRGIDEKQVSANWRRRSRRLVGDRPKVWSGARCPRYAWEYPIKDARVFTRLYSALQSDDIPAYVAAWSFLNHLKGELA